MTRLTPQIGSDASVADGGTALARLHDDLLAEHGRLDDHVAAFDQRLLTIKGWGVTLSLASLGLGFQQDHYGLFLVAALGGFAFWVLEGASKMHQMSFYPRMRDIEVACHDLFGVPMGADVRSSPLIDWGWSLGRMRVRGRSPSGDPWRPEPFTQTGPLASSVRAYFFPHVLFPHVIALVAGLVLFALGLAGELGPI